MSIEQLAKRLQGGERATGSASDWSGPRERWFLLGVCTLIVPATVVAVVTSSAEDWQPWSLVLALAVFVLISERFALDVEVSPRRPLQSAVSSSAPYVLAMVLLGPAPALALSGLGIVADALSRHKSLRRSLSNLDWCVASVAGALLAEALAVRFDVSPDELAFAAVVTAVYAFVMTLDALTGIAAGVLALRESFAAHVARLRVQLQVEGPTALLTAATAYGYATVGLGALALLIVIQLIFQLLLVGLWRSEERRAEIAELSDVRGRLIAQLTAAEENERRRLAAALHDEALQNLLLVRQDLEELESNGTTGRARSAIEATIRQLREEIFDLHPAVLEEAGLVAAIEAVAESAGSRGGFCATVVVDPAVSGDHDALLFTLARELLTNVAKHAQATSVEVAVRRRDGVVELEVRDDGRGFEPGRAQLALGNGHIGLASGRERVMALGGRLQIESEAGEGTTVRVALPQLAAASGPR